MVRISPPDDGGESEELMDAENKRWQTQDGEFVIKYDNEQLYINRAGEPDWKFEPVGVLASPGEARIVATWLATHGLQDIIKDFG
jgi:hypothetical protein